jgi:hypothetical protein
MFLEPTPWEEETREQVSQNGRLINLCSLACFSGKNKNCFKLPYLLRRLFEINSCTLLDLGKGSV